MPQVVSKCPDDWKVKIQMSKMKSQVSLLCVTQNHTMCVYIYIWLYMLLQDVRKPNRNTIQYIHSRSCIPFYGLFLTCYFDIKPPRLPLPNKGIQEILLWFPIPTVLWKVRMSFGFMTNWVPQTPVRPSKSIRSSLQCKIGIHEHK